MKKYWAAVARTAAVVGLVFSATGPHAGYAQTGAAPVSPNPEVQNIISAIGGQAPTGTTGTTGTTTPPPPPQTPSAPLQPSQTTLPPTSQPAQPPTAQPPSQIEQLFSQRAGRILTQVGYDQFGVGSPVPVTQVGAMQDSYVLGVGDQINVTLRGHENVFYQVTVDRDGLIILPELPPITAAGRTFGEVRADIAHRVARLLINTEAFVSIGTVRQVAVLVTGQVASPGVRTLTGLNTPVDAILLSGGILKTGSLRNVTLVRGRRHIRLDLYSLLGGGSFASVGSLTEGDRIIVPAIGQTVAVAGLVNRPGIYELAPGASAITEESLIALAGGAGIAGAKRLQKLELLPDGRTVMVPVTRTGIVKSGEVLFVDFERSSSTGMVQLMGEVSVPGNRALSAAPSISRLIRDADDLTPQSYTLYAVVIRRDPKTNLQLIIPFSIARTFQGKEDLKLADSDIVYVFNQSQVATLAAAASAALGNTASASQNPLANAVRPPATATSSSSQTSSTTSPQSFPPGTTGQSSTTPSNSQPTGANPAAPPLPGGQSVPAGGLAGSLGTAAPSAGVATALLAGNAPPQSSTTPTASLPGTSAAIAGIGQAQATTGATGGAAATVPTTTSATPTVSLDQIAAILGIPTVELVNGSRDYLVTISGEVRNPGSYLAVPDTSLASLIDAAGGVQREADLSAVEITSTLIDVNTGISRTVRNTLRITGREFASVSLKPFDTVRLRPVFSDRNGETVTILGQVRYPGTFDITRGERLSSVLARAGGLTDEAYPYGTVFTRQSAAIQEADGNQRTARLLQDNIATVATQPSTIINASGLAYVQQIAVALQNAPALGRISVTADPVVLATKPDSDMLLESGDTIYIPKRPSTVAVTGEVLNNGAFAYRAGLSAHDYIDLAGGENGAADDSLVFVVLPDGTARPEGNSWFSFGPSHDIPPGSMIVVPRDPQPFNWMVFSINMTDIISKMATTAAALAVVSAR